MTSDRAWLKRRIAAPNLRTLRTLLGPALTRRDDAGARPCSWELLLRPAPGLAEAREP